MNISPNCENGMHQIVEIITLGIKHIIGSSMDMREARHEHSSNNTRPEETL